MQTVLRYLSGLVGVFFLVLGLMFLFSPGGQTAQFALLPAGNGGLSTMRGDMAGLFLGMALFSFLGAIRGSLRLLAVPASFLSFIIFGRLLNLMLDGRSATGEQAMLIEIAMLAILVITMFSLRQGKKGGMAGALALPVLVLMIIFCAWIFQRPLGLRLLQRNMDRALRNQLLPTLPDGLHAGLCGSGSPLADPTRSGPCVFVIAGKHLYLVDTGDGSARKLALLGLPPGQIDVVFLTHFHSDHIAGLGDVFIQRWGGASHTNPLPVYGPQGVDTVVQGFNQAYSLDRTYRIAHHGEATMPPSGNGGVAHPFSIVEGSDASQVIFQEDGLTVTTFAVNHAPVFPAVAYRFDYKGRSIVISGDTAASPTLTKYAHGVDVLFHEGLQPAMVSRIEDTLARANRTAGAKIMHDIPSYHTTPEDAARIAQEAGVRQLVFYHTIPALPVAYLDAAFLGDAPKIFHGPITVSRDGTMISLTPGNTAVTLRELL
jgi:ribonuclease Z